MAEKMSFSASVSGSDPSFSVDESGDSRNSPFMSEDASSTAPSSLDNKVFLAALLNVANGCFEELDLSVLSTSEMETEATEDDSSVAESPRVSPGSSPSQHNSILRRHSSTLPQRHGPDLERSAGKGLADKRFREMMEDPSNSPELNAFRDYCASVYASENLAFYRDVQQLKKEKSSRAREKLGRQLYAKYVGPGASEPVNLPHQAASVLHARFGVMGPKFFAKAEKAIFQNLKSDLWVRFQMAKGAPGLSAPTDVPAGKRDTDRRLRRANSLLDTVSTSLKKGRRSQRSAKLSARGKGAGIQGLVGRSRSRSSSVSGKKSRKNRREPGDDFDTPSPAMTPEPVEEERGGSPRELDVSGDLLLTKTIKRSRDPVVDSRARSDSLTNLANFMRRRNDDHSSSDSSPRVIRARSQSWGDRLHLHNKQLSTPELSTLMGRVRSASTAPIPGKHRSKAGMKHGTSFQVLVFTSSGCAQCRKMNEALVGLIGISAVHNVNLDEYPDRRSDLLARCGQRTTPQLFFNSTHIGDWPAVSQLLETGGIFDLIAKFRGVPPGPDAPELAGARVAETEWL